MLPKWRSPCILFFMARINGDKVINNTNASVSSIQFLDDDLDDKELGGNVTWLPPDDMAQATPKHVCLVRLRHLAIAFPSCSRETALNLLGPQRNTTSLMSPAHGCRLYLIGLMRSIIAVAKLSNLSSSLCFDPREVSHFVSYLASDFFGGARSQ